MNKSAAVITGTGANSIIRAAKTLLLNHYSQRPLHVKICVQTGAPLRIIYSESRDFKQGGKRAIMFKNSLRGGPEKAMLSYGGGSEVTWGGHSSVPARCGQLSQQRTSSIYGDYVPENQPLHDAYRMRLSVLVASTRGKCNRWFLLYYFLAPFP